MSNPFSLQTDNKKFFTELSKASIDDTYDNRHSKDVQQYTNRIKNMNQQLQSLAQKRQQMLFKQSQIDYIIKRQKPSIGLGDFITGVPKNDKKFRVRALLKEKKESLHDFLNKKKEIYLSKMNINIKKQQTSKLADLIRDQQETLKARQLYFQNDVEFMHKFIDGIKKQAEQAQNAVETELRQQQMLVSKLNGLEAQIQKIDNLISKDTQLLHSLQQYKQFIENLYNQKGNSSWNKYDPKKKRRQNKNQQDLFVTQDPGRIPEESQAEDESDFVINYQPINMLQIFNNSQEANIRQIQKLQDKQDQLQTATMEQRQQEALMAQVVKQNEQKIAFLQKGCAKKLEECQRLRQLKKANNNKINILDNQNLDIQKVRTRVFHLYQQINPKRAQQVQQIKNQSQVKRQMAQIQGQIEKMKQLIVQKKQMYPGLVNEVEKQHKNKQKNENMRQKQQQSKRLQLKKQQQQQKKRNQTHNQKQKGRKDMEKVIINKKQKVDKKQKVENENHDQKYFDGED